MLLFVVYLTKGQHRTTFSNSTTKASRQINFLIFFAHPLRKVNLVRPKNNSNINNNTKTIISKDSDFKYYFDSLNCNKIQSYNVKLNYPGH